MAAARSSRAESLKPSDERRALFNVRFGKTDPNSSAHSPEVSEKVNASGSLRKLAVSGEWSVVSEQLMTDD
jgi:hypothetical protein